MFDINYLTKHKPTKCWNNNADFFTFSGSHDQSIRVWDWDIKKGTTNCLQIGRGHERSIECLSVSPDSTRFASGGWDTMLKIWSSGKIIF